MARKSSSNSDRQRAHEARKAAKALRRSRRNNASKDRTRYLGRTA